MTMSENMYISEYHGSSLPLAKLKFVDNIIVGISIENICAYGYPSRSGPSQNWPQCPAIKSFLSDLAIMHDSISCCWDFISMGIAWSSPSNLHCHVVFNKYAVRSVYKCYCICLRAASGIASVCVRWAFCTFPFFDYNLILERLSIYYSASCRWLD